MRTFYTNDFTGHNPVGTSAICLADNEQDAMDKLAQAIIDRGLDDPRLDLSWTVNELEADDDTIVLQDGEY